MTIFDLGLKSSRNKKDLDDVTAAPFLVSFSQLSAAEKHRNGAAVTSLRSFLFRDNLRHSKAVIIPLLITERNSWKSAKVYRTYKSHHKLKNDPPQ